MHNLFFWKLLLGAGWFLLSHSAFADSQCPDGSFNPNQSVCMCSNGGYVGPGERCSRGSESRATYLEPAWGTIAIDVVNRKSSGWGNSRKDQSTANRDALETCGLSTCKIVATVANRCAAIASDTKGIWAVGIDVNEDRALQKAADACFDKGAKHCYEWGKPKCANSPG